MPRTKKTTNTSYFDKLEDDIKTRQSTLSLVLGGLIVLVVGLLVFNYFNRDKANLGPAQQTQNEQTPPGDVSPDKLPGKYTVKEGDTLFLIADKYYQDGFKFTEIAKANNIANVDNVEVGTVLEIPKLEGTVAGETMASPSASLEPSPSPEAAQAPTPDSKGAIAPTNSTPPTADQWGNPIKGDSYTVSEGDWLSTIAGRAYGDIFAYQKIAQANNITNPNLITPGTVLKIPR